MDCRRRSLLGTLAVTAGSGCGLRELPTAGSESETTKPTTPDDPTVVEYLHFNVFTEAAADLASMFEARRSSSDVQPSVTSDGPPTAVYRSFVERFADGETFDCGMMDVIWPAAFAGNDYVRPIDDPENHTARMHGTPVRAVTIDGTIYGMPTFADAQGLYYRRDVLDEHGLDPPETYDDLTAAVETVRANDDRDFQGYRWQGSAGEGLTIMWLEWLWGFGGTVRQGDRLVVNSAEGVRALQRARDLIHEYEVSPTAVTDSDALTDARAFADGDVLFMRNWTFATTTLEADDSAVAGRVGVTNLPHSAGNETASNACLGGWSTFVNANASNPDVAQAFASFLGSIPAQERLALEHGFLPTREELYTEAYTSQSKMLAAFAPILQHTRARPAIPDYNRFSEIVYTACHRVLEDDLPAQTALDEAQARVDEEINEA